RGIYGKEPSRSGVLLKSSAATKSCCGIYRINSSLKDGFLDGIVDEWRQSSCGSPDASQHVAMLAETMNLSASADVASTPAADDQTQSRPGEGIVASLRRASDSLRRDQTCTDPGAQPINPVRHCANGRGRDS